jgi:2-oxoglutarate ferredoxin oxidoreductase subunit delta
MAAKGMVTLEVDRCKGCALCVDVCRPGILQMSTTAFNAKGYRPIEVTDMDLCTGCNVCAITCPDVVFTVYRQKRAPRRVAV